MAFDPFTAFLTVLGTGYSIKQQKEAGELGEAFAEKQAAISKMQAGFAVDQLEKETAKLLSAQEVAFAKGGVTGRGTPEIIKRTTQEQALTEAAAILWGGEVGADTAFFEGRIGAATSRANQAATLLTGATEIMRMARTPG